MKSNLQAFCPQRFAFCSKVKISLRYIFRKGVRKTHFWKKNQLLLTAVCPKYVLTVQKWVTGYCAKKKKS